MVLRVWDKDMTKSDLVGFARIKLSSLMINNGITDWHEILYDNKPAGKVKLTSVFEPVGGTGYDKMSEEFAA